LTWIAKRAKEVETLASVCTGAMLLGRVGLLGGRRATTHWRSLDWMQQSFPAITVEDRLHVVEDGQVLTSAGISAGADMALLVVARYFRRSGRASDSAPHGISVPRQQPPAGLKRDGRRCVRGEAIASRNTQRPPLRARGNSDGP
jgi:transcriptional regulator GlxA family with amidase domain